MRPHCARIFRFSRWLPSQHSRPLRTRPILRPRAFSSRKPTFRCNLCRAGGRSKSPWLPKLRPGFHVNAHEPSEEYLIPTKVTADLPPGVVLVETVYPRGVMRVFRFSKMPLRVYETSFTVRMKFRADAAAPLGAQKIGLTVGYQACNQDACLPPTKIPATAELEIAAVGAPARPANTDIFSPAPILKFPSQR